MTDLRTQIGSDLTSIAEMFVKLRSEAENHADDPDIPGGAAMVMLGPGADIEAWGYVQMSVLFGRLELDRVEAARVINSDIEPPLSFLASWADIVRDARMQEPSTHKAEIAREINYLRSALDWMLSTDDDGEPWFIQVESFADGLSEVRKAMETLLRYGEQVDRGAPCLECGSRLIRQWAGDKDDDPPTTEYDDHWVCDTRGCGITKYTHAQYMKAVEAAAMVEAEWLAAPDMLAAWRIPIGTLQGWASKGKVRKRRNFDTGRMVYDVKQALDCRDAAARDEVPA